MRKVYLFAVLCLVIGLAMAAQAQVKEGAPAAPAGPAEFTIQVDAVLGQCPDVVPGPGNMGALECKIHNSNRADEFFSGSYTSTDSDGDSESLGVDGFASAHYAVTGPKVSASFQKHGVDAGTLTLSILKNGVVVKKVVTTAAHGIVSASAR